MRCLVKNKRAIYYANYTGKTMKTDSNGLKTGEFTQTYGTPTKLMCNYNTIGGRSTQYAFGLDTNYELSVTVDKPCAVTENARAWVGVTPNDDADNFNYIVVKVVNGLNHVLLALDEVKV